VKVGALWRRAADPRLRPGTDATDLGTPLMTTSETAAPDDGSGATMFRSSRQMRTFMSAEGSPLEVAVIGCSRSAERRERRLA
jgi:hypothetical protein